MADIEDRWLSVEEICKYLGVSKDTVYRWIDKHSMPAHRMGRLWKFKRTQVDTWVEAGGANRSAPASSRQTDSAGQ
jgi:excisionase family DNA binding protein